MRQHRLGTGLLVLAALGAGAETARAAMGEVRFHQKISQITGGLLGGLENSDRFGSCVASLGDLDGNGVADLAVGAVGDDAGGMDRGAVWILYLNPNGTVMTHQKISDTQGGFGGGLADGDTFGASVAAVGDLDGDGFGDLAVGAWPDQPLVVVYRGGPKGIDPEKPSWVLASPGGDDGLIFGSNLTSAGDLNGDGYADMIVAEDADASFGGPPGRFLIYFGGPDGPASTPSIILHPTDPAQLAASGIAEAGDVDGDGFPDLVALAPHADETGGPGLYLYRGGPSGPSDATRVLLASLPIDPDCFTPPLSPTPGDLNGDGFADVVVGLSDCLQQHPAPGRELVVYGGPTPTVTIFSKPTDFGGSGFAVHIAWDVDGDGFDDLVAGASAGAQASGGVVYWGSPEGVSDDARTAFGVSSSTDTSGFAVTAGDLDGDGRDDLAIGTMLTGTVTTFSGGPSGLSPGATLVPKSNGMDYEPWLR